MTTIQQARSALRTRVEALKATWADYVLKIEYDNLFTVNPETQVDPFLRVNLVLMDGMQADLALKPIHRVMGTIIIEALDKQGAGNAKMDKLVNHFYRPIQMTDTIPPLRTQAARIGTRMTEKGWAATAALIPFWYDDFPT